jgi:two-component system osmolarity sensor histidine kinase EnvZ
VRLYVLQPVTERAAEELAALLELAAKVWVELPPWTRADYESELNARHGLRITPAQAPLSPAAAQPEYLQRLEVALARRFGQTRAVQTDAAQPGWYWVDLPVGQQTLRLGFRQTRLRQQIPAALVLLVGAGALFILVSTLLLVRHVTRPLARLHEAVRRLGRGETFQPLPVSGTAELAELAHRINRAEGEVRELLANRTTLLAGISHDLRTPIARMQLEVELLEGRADPELLDQLRGDLVEMDGLIGRTLELARGLDRREPADGLLAEVAAALVQSYERGEASVRADIAPQCPIRVPTEVFRRVLGNLLDNAVRYGGGSPVELSIRCEPRRASVSVRDHGPGIPAGEREAVLRPFHRLDHSRSRDTGGSGLGLAIVRQLCDAYGWTLTLSDAPGGGLVVGVAVPDS